MAQSPSNKPINFPFGTMKIENLLTEYTNALIKYYTTNDPYYMDKANKIAEELKKRGAGAMAIAMALNIKTLYSTNKNISTLDANGYNMIANMERNRNSINIDERTGKITGIPHDGPDYGYGHDKNQLPINPPPNNPMTAKEAYDLLVKDSVKFTDPIAKQIPNLNQNQFNAMVGLRYNIGGLGVIKYFDNGIEKDLVDYLKAGNYDRTTMKSMIYNYYDTQIKKNPNLASNREGWYNRTEKTLDIFFDGNYGDMPIDAVNGTYKS